MHSYRKDRNKNAINSDRRSNSIEPSFEQKKKLKPIIKRQLMDILKNSWKQVQICEREEKKAVTPKVELSEERSIILKSRARASLQRINASKYLTPQRSIARLLNNDRDCKN